MRLLVGIGLALLTLGSCKKDADKKCIARSADGTEMYEVVGENKCQEQIDIANGEYCDCSEE
jgi:hypothetical protein